MSDFEYTIVRSSRKRTMGITIDNEGNVEVRIPRRVTIREAEAFVEEKHDWIVKNREKMLARKEKHDAHDWDRVRDEIYPWIRGDGGRQFREKVASWAQRMGVEYNRITIRDISSRWASCSAKGNLSFTWKIFVMPERLADYLVVHELAHLKQMNHSPEFWNIVSTYIPDYKILKKELEEYV